MGKKASQAGHECISSKETVLRSEDTLEEESDERERLEVCETFFCSHKSEICCAIFFFLDSIHCHRYQGRLLQSPPTSVLLILNLWGIMKLMSDIIKTE